MKELELAKRIAVRAGDLLLRRQGKPGLVRIKNQSPSNIVTEMDHASEEMIVGAIRREFPDHAVVAEERGSTGDSPFRWYVDPLDGTTNFAHGLPIWTVTIAFEAHGRIEAAVTYAPAYRDLFWARRGRGAYRNRSRLRVSRVTRLERALLATGFAYDVKYRMQNLKLFGAFLPLAQAIRRPGAASLDLAWTACGALDGYWEFRLGPWDMAAGLLLVAEAGGRITAFDGTPADIPRGQVVAANPRIHREMLAVVRSVRL
jgi:myo-inositol-1(or 4)-monophosphatase